MCTIGYNKTLQLEFLDKQNNPWVMVGDSDSLGFLTILLKIVLRITEEQFGGMFGIKQDREKSNHTFGTWQNHPPQP